jgi:Na+-driven multidrug efflux pump
VSGLFVTLRSATGGAGDRDTRSPLYISIVSQVILPLGYCTILQATRGLQANDIWLAIVLGHMARCLLSFGRFRQQKWRNIQVDIEPARTA